MWSAFCAWWDASAAAVQGSPRVEVAALPDPNGGRALEVGLVDPSTVVVVTALGQVGGHEANGLYVGLVGQDPSDHWRGLTGFFLTWCPGCDEGGEQLLRDVRTHVSAHHVALSSLYDMPEALHPQDGWFERDRGLLAGWVSPRHGLGPCWTRTGAPVRGAALVATGPTFADLGNVVLIEGPDDIAVLARLRPGRELWTWRTGELAALEILAGLGKRSVTVSTARMASRAPLGWGSYRLHSGGPVVGPVPDLRRALHKAVAGLPPGAQPTFRTATLGSGPVRLREAITLAQALRDT